MKKLINIIFLVLLITQCRAQKQDVIKYEEKKTVVPQLSDDALMTLVQKQTFGISGTVLNLYQEWHRKGYILMQAMMQIL
jgi:hypothetical protein